MKAWIWKQSKRLQEEEGFVEKGLLNSNDGLPMPNNAIANEMSSNH